MGARCLFLILLLAPPGLGAEKPFLDTVQPGEVLIQRDRWGVPHIYGRSAAAVAFGAGFVQAEDHLDGMLRLFLVARGESSRVDGQSALREDRIERMLMHREIVERTWNAVPQATRDYYQAFANGINRYIDTHPDEKQPWYWKIEAQDVAAYLRYTITRYSLRIAMAKIGGGPRPSPAKDRMPMRFPLRAAPAVTRCCMPILICRGTARIAWAMRCT